MLERDHEIQPHMFRLVPKHSATAAKLLVTDVCLPPLCVSFSFVALSSDCHVHFYVIFCVHFMYIVIFIYRLGLIPRMGKHAVEEGGITGT
jgi:hypothetical protein